MNEVVYTANPSFLGRDQFTFHTLDGIDSLWGRMSGPGTVTVDIQGMVTREFQVVCNEDDAYASPDVQNVLSEFLHVGHHSSGMRFTNVDIPPGSKISSAYLKMSARIESIEVPVRGAVQAEASVHATEFTDDQPHLYDRLVTESFVPWIWEPGPLQPGIWHHSPDIGAVVQEVVDQEGWWPGYAVGILYSGDNQNSADVPFHGCAHPNFDRAAKLQITFNPKGTSALDFIQVAPVANDMKVEAAYDVPVTISLDATDDGLPDPPGRLTFTVTSFPSHGTLETPGGEPIPSPGQLPAYGNEVVYRPFGGFIGEDSLRFQSSDGGILPFGGVSGTAKVTIIVRPEIADTLTDEFQIVDSADDACAEEELTVNKAHTPYLYVGRGTAAMRFWNVDIPWGSLILDARLRVYMSTPCITKPFKGTITVQDTSYASAFSETDPTIHERPLAEVGVPWDWTVDDFDRMISDDDGAWCTSPDIAEVIQEIVDRPDWVAGNPVVVVCAGDVSQGAGISFYAYDYAGNSDRAAKLQVTYVPAFGAHREPIATDEPNQSPPEAQDAEIVAAVDTPRTITLNATDDGLPAPPGLVTLAILSLPSHGTLEHTWGMPITEPTLLRQTNQVVYVPAPGYAGQDAFAFRAHDRGRAPWGGASETAVATISVKDPITREYQVCASQDDASTSGLAAGLDIYCPTLEVGVGSSGIRFREIHVPQGSAIASAHLCLCKASPRGTRMRATLYGEASNNAEDFQMGEEDLFKRPRTEASVPWPWEYGGGQWNPPDAAWWYESPSLVKIIQEIIDRSDWSEGNAIAILYLTDIGEHSHNLHFYAFDNVQYPEERAPKLEITYAH